MAGNLTTFPWCPEYELICDGLEARELRVETQGTVPATFCVSVQCNDPHGAVLTQPVIRRSTRTIYPSFFSSLPSMIEYYDGHLIIVSKTTSSFHRKEGQDRK